MKVKVSSIQGSCSEGSNAIQYKDVTCFMTFSDTGKAKCRRHLKRLEGAEEEAN